MHLFFDLDGTLTDSCLGITRCINHALSELGCETVAEPRLRELLGAPLTGIFATILASDDAALVDRAVVAYRARFDVTGIFENQVFPGIPEALRTLCALGHTLQVVTAKPAVSAQRVVDHFALDGYFAAVHGPALADRGCDKADLVKAALDFAGGGRTDSVMIGDIADDIRSGKAHGIRTIGVTWGYGLHADLIAAAPDYVAESVADLTAWIAAVSGTPSE